MKCLRHCVRSSIEVLLGTVVGLALIGAVLTQPLWPQRSPGAAMEVDAKGLERHVRMLSETFVPRDQGHLVNLDRTANYIRDQFAAAGGRVSEQAYTVDGILRRNVLARFGPEQGERIVVGAHYDAFGELPGADDNASGVAGLLELARLLGQRALPGPVELVAYTLEEPPFFRSQDMGSSRHAAALKGQGVQVRAMLCLEMIGYFSDGAGSQAYPAPALKAIYPSTGNFITVVGDLGSMGLVRRVKAAMRAATPLPVVSLNAPRAVPGVDYSDHHPYWDQGYPAVMITDTAFNRNLAYHTTEDTPDRLDYQRMAQVVQGVQGAVMELADAK